MYELCREKVNKKESIKLISTQINKFLQRGENNDIQRRYWVHGNAARPRQSSGKH